MSGKVRIAHAPGRLDVMGGSAEYAGGLICTQTTDCGTAAVLAPRPDRVLHRLSFNGPSQFPSAQTYSMTVLPNDELPPGNSLLACLMVLHQEKLIDLRGDGCCGFDLAILSNIPPGAGLCESSAEIIATMILLRDHFEIAAQLDPPRFIDLAQRAQKRMTGEEVSKASLFAIASGTAGRLLKVLSQSHEPPGFLQIPQGIRIVGIDTGVRPNAGDDQFMRTRVAAFMGQKMILAKMEEMGLAAGMRLVGDPMRGYLANLALDDYKKYFRSALPESLKGSDFLASFGTSIDASIQIDASVQYAVQSATDHQVHEPSRVKNFIRFMEQAAALPAQSPQRSAVIDKAGHLMYASHISCSRDAQLGAPEADLLVDSVRKNERAGLYGAKITDRGQGGSVAVLMNDSEKAIEAINTIVSDYQRQTGNTVEVFWNTSAGVFETGTRLISLGD